MVAAIIIPRHTGASASDAKAVQRVLDNLNQARVLDTAVVVNGDGSLLKGQLAEHQTRLLSAAGADEMTVLRLAIETLRKDHLDGLLISSTDPSVTTQAVFVDVLHEFWRSQRRIIVSRHDGKRTTPIVLSSELFGAIGDGTGSLFSFIERHAQHLQVVEISSEGALRRMNAAMTALPGGESDL